MLRQTFTFKILANSLTIACFLFFTFQIQAQDTTVIQTFTWDSIGRSAYFDFPDDPEKTYEKILMFYNMRCHDAAVGSGNVGCKEWDYSCNTFVTVPEKTDSSIAYKYEYDVSQISDDYFAYITSPHYTYYAYDQITTDYKHSNSETAFTIKGDEQVSLAFNTAKATKIQVLYTSDELLNAGFYAGEIDGMALNFTDENTEIHSLRINIKAIEDSMLMTSNPQFESFVPVYFRDSYFPNAGINRFNFHSPFDWDGSSNILIELSFEPGTDHTWKLNAYPTENKSVVAMAGKGDDHALEFGGSWGIELDPTIFASVDKEISISFWAFGRPQDLPNRNTTVLEGYDENNKRQVNVHLPWSNSGIYWDCGYQNGSYDRISKTAPPEAFKARWSHWTFTKNSETGSMKIYLNGRLWHAETGKTKAINIRSFRFGSGIPHNLGYYGMLDAFSLWNKELDANSVQELMAHSIDSLQALQDNLLAFYNFEEGEGNVIHDSSPNERPAYFEGGPMWRSTKGDYLKQYFTALDSKPEITFYRGDYEKDETIEQVIDTVITPQHSVVQYAVEQSKLVVVDTFFLWEATDSKIYGEDGEEIESIYIDADEYLIFDELEYFNFKESKLELLSLVTPYGNGLDLGPEGKTFTFDLTDFSPVLKGKRKISVEFGATQEELDIKFLFIEGTPARNVLDIQNIWPFSRGYYKSIQQNRIFEPRAVFIPENTAMAKIRSSISGHGQNGEFQARNHRIYIDGNARMFDFKVWKECAFNPIYPQGGTWIYDRAGWCPGMATDLHEFDISDVVSKGDFTDIDYEVFGPYMNQANYLVSNQLVLYGEANFELDAAVERVVRPSKSVEFERFNPLCSDPEIIIKNRGKQTLTSLTVHYGVTDGVEKTFLWNGSLAFLEEAQFSLPVDDYTFWGTQDINTFEVQISNPNGETDEYAANDRASSTFEMPEIFEGYERWLLRLRTNYRAAENEYSIVDQDGNIILSRKNLSNSTTYNDEITLPAGCYSLLITDSGNDGLSFWANPGAGSGALSIRRMVNDNVSFERKRFNPDFGGSLRYDFIIDATTGTDQPDHFTRMGIYPNPVDELLHIELEGHSSSDIFITILTMEGIPVYLETFKNTGKVLEREIKTRQLPPGQYLLFLRSNEQVWVKKFIKI